MGTFVKRLAVAGPADLLVTLPLVGSTRWAVEKDGRYVIDIFGSVLLFIVSAVIIIQYVLN